MRLEPGEVVSYGEVAEEAGFPGAARAVGNLVDRIRSGEVTDFIQVRFSGVPFFDPFPSFNVADAAITVVRPVVLRK